MARRYSAISGQSCTYQVLPSHGQVTTLSLTLDHRITDGAPAARFLERVAQLLERPYLLM